MSLFVRITFKLTEWAYYSIFRLKIVSWWRHQMETFSALLAICAGNSPVSGEFPAQRPVTRSFDVFFDLRLNKRLSKQWWGWWFETPSRPLWRHWNVRHNPVIPDSRRQIRSHLTQLITLLYVRIEFWSTYVALSWKPMQIILLFQWDDVSFIGFN